MSKLASEDMESLKVLMSQIKAFCSTIEGILSNNSTAEIGRYASYSLMASTYNDFAEKSKRYMPASVLFYTFNLDAIPKYGGATWSQEKMILEQALLNSKMLLSGLEGTACFVNDELENIENFFQSRLRSVIFSLPERELEIQDAIETLLIGKGLQKGSDYDRESGKFEFSGREFIPDFVIPKMNLCIEAKLLKKGRKSSMVEQISADITAYKKKYQNLFFIVYDLGVIQNEAEFRKDIEMLEGVKLIIVKH